MENKRRASTWRELIDEVCMIVKKEKKAYSILRYHTTQLHWYLPTEQLKDDWDVMRLPANYHPVANCWYEPLIKDGIVFWSQVGHNADFKEHFLYPDTMPIMIKNTLVNKEKEEEEIDGK